MKQDEVLASLEWRYAVKKFDATRKISPQDWAVLESALILSPSGYGLQPWKFIVVQDPETRRKLRAASLDQTQVEDCSHLVVLASKSEVDASYIDSYVGRVSSVRQVPRENLAGYYQMMVDDIVTGPKSHFNGEWAARQTYIALGTLTTAAALLQVDACPMEGLVPERYNEILGLRAQGYRTLVACALGYRSTEDKYAYLPKVRFERENVVQFV
jgi:nitroreductase